MRVGIATRVTTAGKKISTRVLSSSSSSSRALQSSISQITKRNNSTESNSIPNYISGSTTHFGFRDVPIDQKESEVRNVFENVAESYDVMNDLMSGGLHRMWKDELIAMTGVAPMARALRKQAIHDKVSDVPGNLMSILDV